MFFYIILISHIFICVLRSRTVWHGLFRAETYGAEWFGASTQMFPKINDAKIKEGFFVEPQIQEILCDTEFVSILEVKEL